MKIGPEKRKLGIRIIGRQATLSSALGRGNPVLFQGAR